MLIFFIMIPKIIQVVEKFFSKELTCVITDQPTTAQRSASQSKGIGNLAADLTNTRGVSIRFNSYINWFHLWP